MQVVAEVPINNLSFGNVGVNILRQFWRRNIDLLWYPCNGQADTSAFDKLDKDFLKYLGDAANKANLEVKKDLPTFKLWHLNGSQCRITKSQLLYTFYELDQPTDSEINLCKMQDKTVFSSRYSAEKFSEQCDNVTNIPIGFDEDFFQTDKKYLDNGVVHFGLMGKFEKRKHTDKIIKLWLEKFANNNKYQLSLLVTNPFFKPEEMENIFRNVFNGIKYKNVNIVPHLAQNSQVNEFLNSIDIDLTGLSGAEGWNLPSFNATALGKWSIVLNATAHKEWANDKNCILVESNGREPCYDGKFFVQGAQFNQGNIYTWDRDIVSQAMDQAVSKVGQINTEGLKLKTDFSYEKTADRLITELEAIS
jgi:hypothetical protein